MNEIDNLEDYLSEWDDYFSELKPNFDNTMIRAKINELVFWLEMYKNDLEDSNE